MPKGYWLARPMAAHRARDVAHSTPVAFVPMYPTRCVAQRAG